MNIFNRREIFLTRRNEDLSRVTSCLTTNGIRYTTVTSNITNAGRYRGMPNIRAEYVYEYRVYVHKNDFERAKHAIR